MIKVRELSKIFRTHQKEPGLRGSVRSLFRRQYREKTALDRVNVSVSEGEILGLVGANGAGKTTLVKILAGVIHPSGGDADVMGFVPWERSVEFRRSIALIMGQKAQLWWDLPAADCFVLLREIYRLDRQQFQRSLDFLVSSLGVGDLLKTQIRRLSLGERMKMELIAALVHQPRVVFLDEPTIGLDLMAQRAIRDFILKYREEHRPAMILTSHYMEDIERLCRRIVIIREGRFIYDGSLKEVTSRYASHKLIAAKLAEDAPVVPWAFDEGVRKVADQPGMLKVMAPRTRVAEIASHILKQYAVIDLSIEEEDIGTTIETIMRGTPQ